MKNKILNISLIIILLVSMLVTLTGCGNKDTKGDSKGSSNRNIEFDYSKLNANSENVGKNAQVKTVLNEDIKPSSYEGVQFTGNTNDLNEANIQAGNLNWVVLAEDDNNYMLTTVKPTSDTIELQGADGYNNAVQALNAYCAKYYSVEVNGKKYVARNINMNDIEAYYKDKTDNWKQSTLEFENYNKTGIEAKGYQYYPSLYAMENGSSMDGKLGTSENPNNYEPYNNNYKSNGTSTKGYLDTYYFANKKSVKENYTNQEAYNIIFESGGLYFVATRTLSVYENKMNIYEKEKGSRNQPNSVNFGIRTVSSEGLSRLSLMNSNSKPDPFKKYLYPARPVVVIPKSEIQL